MWEVLIISFLKSRTPVSMYQFDPFFNSTYTRHLHCVIFLYNWTQSIDGFSLLLQRYVRQGSDAKNPAILSFYYRKNLERTQLDATHAQLLEQLSPITFEETCIGDF